MEAKKVNSVVEARKEYLKMYPDPSYSKYVDSKTYLQVMKVFFEELVYQLITTGEKVILPSTLGYLQAIRFKSDKFNPIDYNTSDKVNEKKGRKGKDRVAIRHNNAATDGYWTKIHWGKKAIVENKYGARFKNSTSYSFKLLRSNQRTQKGRKPARVTLFDFFKKEGWLFYKENAK